MQLARREALGWWRNKPGLVASVLIPACLNLIFSCVFFQVGDTTQPDYDINSHFGARTL